MHSLTTTPITTAQDNANRARKLIELGLAMDPEARDETITRLIAAAIHDGADSALCRFAGTGELQSDAALSELSAVVIPFEQEWWVDALGRHVLYSTRHHP